MFLVLVLMTSLTQGLIPGLVRLMQDAQTQTMQLPAVNGILSLLSVLKWERGPDSTIVWEIWLPKI